MSTPISAIRLQPATRSIPGMLIQISTAGAMDQPNYLSGANAPVKVSTSSAARRCHSIPAAPHFHAPCGRTDHAELLCPNRNFSHCRDMLPCPSVMPESEPGCVCDKLTRQIPFDGEFTTG